MNQLFEEPEADIRVNPRPQLEAPVPRNEGTIEEHVKTILKWRMPILICWTLPRNIRERRGEAVVSAIVGLESHGKEGVMALGKLMLRCNKDFRERIAPSLFKSDHPEILESIYSFMMQESNRVRIKQIFLTLIVSLYVVGSMPKLFHLTIDHDVAQLLYTIRPSLLIFFATVSLILGETALSTDSKSLLQRLSEVNDIRYLSLFLRCSKSPNPDINILAKDIVISTLKGVKSSDRYKISASTQKELTDRIDIWKPQLTLAILNALEKIGDEKAIPRVEKLIAELPGRKYFNLRRVTPGSSEANDEAMQEAAESCIAILKNRAVEFSESQTLLRASSVPVQAEKLLRPAQSSGEDQHPEELLRPL